MYCDVIGNLIPCAILSLSVVIKPLKTMSKMKQEIIELWHIARISAGNSRYARMIYIKNEMLKKYPTLSPKKLWLDIDEFTQVGF